MNITNTTMMEPTVFIVDDDNEMRNAMRRLLRSTRLNVELYASAREFMESYRPEYPGCIILDVRMPGMSGLDLQEWLVEHGVRTPIIIVTGYGDVPTAVRAMKGGAVEFIEKPLADQVLLDCVKRCIALDREQRQEAAQHAKIKARMSQLTAREREVLDLIVAGKTNKMIATELDISSKTVEAHRSRVMEKIQATSIVSLAQMYLICTSPARHES